MKNILLLIAIGFLSSCAATYKPINPKSINYSINDIQYGIGLSYKYDVLGNTMNRKYAKKELKKNVKLIAVRITNYTDSALVINRNAFFYSGNKEAITLSPNALKVELGQVVPSYIFYALLSFIQYREVTNGVVTKSAPIGIALALPIMIGNMVMAGSANKKFQKELIDFDLNGRVVQPGEIVTRLIGIRNFNFMPLTLKRY